MADAGEIKAKVVITYDGSGVEKAKEDLAKLAESAGSVGEGANVGSEGLAGLDEQAQKTAESTQNLNSSISGMEKPLENASKSITGMTEAVQEHQAAIEETGTAYADLQKPMGETISLFQDATPKMQSMQKSLNSVSDSYTNMASNLQEAAPSFREAFNIPNDVVLQFDKDGRLIGDSVKYFDAATPQVQNFGKAMQGSAPQVQAFTSQVSDLNTAVKSSASAINEFGGVGNALYGPMPKMAEAIGFGEAFGNAGRGILSALNDVAMPLMAVQMIGMAVQATGQAIYDSAVIVEGKAAHSYGTFTGTVDALGQSIQNLGGQFSESFGQSIMPTLNALNAQFADQGGVAGFLGESVGGALGILFNLGQIASGINPMGGIASLESMFGIDTGVVGPGPISANPLQKQIDQFYQQANDPQYLAAQAYYSSAMAKAQKNQAIWDTSHYAGTTGPLDPMNEILQAQVVRANGGVYGHVPEDPNLAWLDNLGNPGGGGYAEFYTGRSSGSVGNSSSFLPSYGNEGYLTGGGEENQSAWGAIGDFLSFTPAVGIPRALAGGGGPYSGLFGKASSDDLLMGPKIGDIGQFFGNIGNAFGNLWNGLNFNLGDSESLPSLSGCFPAGTRVMLADHTEKPIEDIHIGDHILAHNGKEQIRTTVLALIRPRPKMVYDLAFSDGTYLRLTNSHPISTAKGWKSLSPEATKQENPDLEVSALQIGDIVYTMSGSTMLLSVKPLDVMPIYNITVNEPHTFYANKVLVHNKSNAVMQSVAQSEAPRMDMKNTPLMNSIVGNFSMADLNHTFTATATWVGSNLQNTFQGAASWVAQGLSNTFQGVAAWVGQGLSNTFSGIASWIGSGLSNTFQGVASWFGQNLSNTFQGVANWFGTGLQNTFQGIASWTGSNLSNTFNGVASWFGSNLSNTFKGIADWVGKDLDHTFIASPTWVGQNLNPVFTASPTWLPGFAGGVQNFSGGYAVVGERGPELVYLPQGSNVIPNHELDGITGGGGGFGGGIVINITHVTQLDGRTIMKESAPYLATAARQLTGGKR